MDASAAEGAECLVHKVMTVLTVQSRNECVGARQLLAVDVVMICQNHSYTVV
jgi:hypothetical protein